MQEGIPLVQVAHLKGIPFFAKGSVKKRFPKDPSAWLLVDWKGRFNEAYDLQEKMCSILLFDRVETLVCRRAVEDMSLPVLKEMLVRTEAVKRSRQPF